MCYSLRYNAPTMLLAGNLEVEELRFQATGQQHRWVHYTASCNTQSSDAEDGHYNCSKHVELIGIINKPLLLRLVGCLYCLEGSSFESAHSLPLHGRGPIFKDFEDGTSALHGSEWALSLGTVPKPK